MSNEIVVLTKQEIGDAIVNYIGIFKKSMGFFPYKIVDTDIDLSIPDSVMFHLEYMPMGTKIGKETEHAL